MRIVVCDFSNLIWTNWYGSGASQDTHLDALEDRLRQLGADLGVPIKDFIFAKDQRAVEKYQQYPAYKAGRRLVDFDPRDSAEQWIRRTYGARFCWSPDREADDAIASVIQPPLKRGWNVVVVTADHDLWQLLVHPGLQVYDILTRQFVEPDRVVKHFEVGPVHIALVKALWGDATDNVPNVVPRMQKQLLPLIRSTSGRLEDFWLATLRATLTDRCNLLLNKSMADIKRNYNLVRLNRECSIVWEVDRAGDM